MRCVGWRALCGATIEVYGHRTLFSIQSPRARTGPRMRGTAPGSVWTECRGQRVLHRARRSDGGRYRADADICAELTPVGVSNGVRRFQLKIREVARCVVCFEPQPDAMRRDGLHSVANGTDRVHPNLLAASAKPSRARGATPSAAPAHSACRKIANREGMPVPTVARSCRL